MKKTVVVYTGNPIEMPPLLTLLRLLIAIGEDVSFVGIDWWDYYDAIASTGAKCYSVHVTNWSISFWRHPVKRLVRHLLRLKHLNDYRQSLWSAIDSAREGDENFVLWSCSMYTAALLGDRALELGRRHVHTFFELGDEQGSGLSGFTVSKFYASATIVECEINRAEIIKVLKNLPRRPFVMPNCQYGLPRSRNLPVRNGKASAIIKDWHNRFVFLYQGGFVSDRAGIVDVLDWLCDEFKDDVIAIMLYKSELNFEKLRKHNNLWIVPYVPAPFHLDITSHASVGVAYYTSGTTIYSPLNALYCAPNKIYEYAAFGLPTLGNDVPGLRYTVGASGAGECFSSLSKEDVVAAARKIKSQYEAYSKRATKFFDDTDMVAKTKEVIDFARCKETL